MEDDSYAGKLQIKVYGDKDGDNYKEQYIPLATGSSTTTATFDASILGSTFWGVTLQVDLDPFPGPLTAKVKSAKLIKADDSEVNIIISSAWGCTVTSETKPKTTNIKGVINHQDENDAIYNLNGQRISNPRKGIYIQNGKKYVMK